MGINGITALTASVTQAVAEVPGFDKLRVCTLEHPTGSEASNVYSHYGSVRVCIRLYATNNWVYDPGFEDPPQAWAQSFCSLYDNHLIHDPHDWYKGVGDLRRCAGYED